jgi:MscS family membrane protein
MRTRALKILLLLIASFDQQSFSQLPGVPQQTAERQAESSDDPLDRSTPRGTVIGFIKAVGQDDYDTALGYLDTNQKGDLGRKLSMELKTVLDQEASIEINELSRRPDGESAVSAHPNRYLAGVITSSSKKVEIWLDRVKRSDDPPIWLFSRETLKQIPELYEDIDAYSGVEHTMPSWLRVKILWMPLWQLFGVLLALPLAILLASLLVRLIGKLMAAFAGRLWGEVGANQCQRLTGPLRLLLLGILFSIGGMYSNTALSRFFWKDLGKVLILLGVTWLFMKMIGLLSTVIVSRMKKKQSYDRIALTGMLGRLAQIATLVIGILVVLHMAGVNLTAALTGLGIGGLAVAFAAQKTIENLFGGIMITSDHPIRIGDACKVGDVVGDVVDIGLRSTRVRTIDRTIVTIPNGQLAASNLENYTLRDKFWFHPVVSLTQQTTVEEMQAVLGNIRELLSRHPNVESSTARVRFVSVRTSSFDVEIFAYVFAPDFGKYLAVQEELLLQILGIVESSGTELALPTQVTHLKSDRNAAPSGEPKEPLAAFGER